MIDFQWKVGAVQKACTSMPCSWNEGGRSQTVLSTRMAEINIRKPTAEKLKQNSITTGVQKLFDAGIATGMSFFDF